MCIAKRVSWGSPHRRPVVRQYYMLELTRALHCHPLLSDSLGRQAHGGGHGGGVHASVCPCSPCFMLRAWGGMSLGVKGRELAAWPSPLLDGHGPVTRSRSSSAISMMTVVLAPSSAHLPLAMIERLSPLLMLSTVLVVSCHQTLERGPFPSV